MPTCQVHAALMNSSTLGQVLLRVAGWGHGTMHVNLGGVYGECTSAMAKLYQDYEGVLAKSVSLGALNDAVQEKFHINPGWKDGGEDFTLKEFVEDSFHLEYFHIYRTLWRSQTCAVDGKPVALQCPESCDLSTPQSDCKCKCTGVDSADFDWENLEPCMYVQNKTEWITKVALPVEFRKALVTTFCSAGVVEGEMLESASPIDITFWMIHPIIDRLVMAKRLAAIPGNHVGMGSYGDISPFADESWLTYSAYSTDKVACVGHGPDDEALAGFTSLSRFAELADTNGDGSVSNLELYEAIDPSKPNVDYIYDNYEWSHCDDDAVETSLDDDELEAIHTASYTATSLKPLRKARASRDKIAPLFPREEV